jgi:P-aminobenzoate N-oxygenase AurF
MRGRAKASKSAPWRFSEFFSGKTERETGGDFMERGHQIDIRNVAYFRHDYDGEHADMRHLYEQAKLDQWNAATDIDWSEPLDSDGGLIADDLVDIHGTKFWDRLSASERVEVNRAVTRWRLSTLMAGEHGAMLVCSQLVENVQGQDAKLFQATQVVDEGRHNEVLHRYMVLRLEGRNYPLANNVQEIFDTLLSTGAWYLKTIGLQLVAETFAVSLFRMLAESSKDAVLRQVCRRILQDEARHMGFGMLSLPAVVAEAGAAEQREMEDFAVWALNRTLRGIFPLAAYQEIGFSRGEIEEIRQLRRERAAGGDETAFRKFFRRDLHAGLVRNLRKVGVLSDRVAPDLQALGISLAAA